MKVHIYIFGILTLLFVLWNVIFGTEDTRTNALIYLLGSSLLLLYLACIGILYLRKAKKEGK